jgi:hypothetical protein
MVFKELLIRFINDRRRTVNVIRFNPTVYCLVREKTLLQRRPCLVREKTLLQRCPCLVREKTLLQRCPCLVREKTLQRCLCCLFASLTLYTFLYACLFVFLPFCVLPFVVSGICIELIVCLIPCAY